MSLIERVYASGGDVIIDTLELTCPAWTEPVLICGGFEDVACTAEDGRSLQHIAAGIDVSLPKKSNSASQTLNFAIDNVLGEAQQKMDQAKAAGAPITQTYRRYLASDLSAPAEPPIRMKAFGAGIEGTTVQITAGYGDLINRAFPRDKLTTLNAPCMKYL